MTTTLPPDHPQRIELNDEAHARPPERLVAPLRISYLALLSDGGLRERERQGLAELARRFEAAPPGAGANHYSADLGPFRLKWERHTEFARYKIIAAGVGGEDPFAEPAVGAVPADWVASLPGQLIAATHAALVRDGGDGPPDYEALSAGLFDGNALVGASIAGGAATALTDFRVRPDGFGRLLVQDRGMTPRQAGRMVQRLLEMDSYRVMALLTLPVARGLAPFLARCERELGEVTTALAAAGEADEAALLDRLTRLEAEIGQRNSENHDRFSAAEAYHGLVERRIVELREERIQGLQTFGEFTERRLAPAMSTCRVVAANQESLSRRVARATQLLSTRVAVTAETQNRAVLESMNRRAELQLRLQETVEGLSVAALTYYVVGLVGYAAKGAEAAGIRIDPDIAMGVSVPAVAVLVALGVRRMRRRLARRAGGTVN